MWNSYGKFIESMTKWTSLRQVSDLNKFADSDIASIDARSDTTTVPADRLQGSFGFTCRIFPFVQSAHIFSVLSNE